MIYFIVFIFSFLFSIWVKTSGEIITIELGNYTVTIDLYFIIISCVAVLLLLTICIKFFYSIGSAFTNLKSKRREKEETLIFEAFFSIDLNYTENINKLSKIVNEENDRFLLLKTFNSGKAGNYTFFTNSIASIMSKNRNLALLLSYKLIFHLRKDKLSLQKFVDHCFHAISDKILSLPFQIENAILKNDWLTAIIKSKEAVKCGIYFPFNQKEILAPLYCALARDYENSGNIKEAIKSVLRAENYNNSFQPINYLKAEFYINLGKIRKASDVLEKEYGKNPTPQVAKLYLNLSDKNTAERLYSLKSDYYFSYCALALAAISLHEYDLADQHLNTAIKKVNHLSVYLIMIQLKILLKDYDKAKYWLNEIDTQATSDPSWRCKSCNKDLKRWDYKCCHCNDYDCISLN
ncbi:MAG: heme biosynthesis protein HemY [Wolbachia endosymbiont of Fragariocoptes setiger]|nr:heme biosynthesis protein HemY [Wolbachia endosymbiont of Fragariocoptes setiger]